MVSQKSGPDPKTGYAQSQCTPLFFNAYRLRGAGAVIHTHSIHAVMVTLLCGKEWRITHQEMIKGIRVGRFVVGGSPVRMRVRARKCFSLS